MRNHYALSQGQINNVLNIWQFITSTTKIATFEHPEGERVDYRDISVEVSEASTDGSNTRYVESSNTLFIGADVYPGDGRACDANSNLSVLACLCHELAHIERYRLGFRRPFPGKDIASHIDEAETSLHASFRPELPKSDRLALVEDAKQRIEIFLDNGRLQ